jgi:hypothetical protein
MSVYAFAAALATNGRFHETPSALYAAFIRACRNSYLHRAASNEAIVSYTTLPLKRNPNGALVYTAYTGLLCAVIFPTIFIF